MIRYVTWPQSFFGLPFALRFRGKLQWVRRFVLASQGQFKNRILYIVELRAVGFSVGGRCISCRISSLLTEPSPLAFLLVILVFFRFSLFLLQKSSNELAQV